MSRICKGGEAYDCSEMVREWNLLPNIYSLKATLSSIIRWFKRMSEAIISRRGYTAEGKPEWHTETITGSTTWTVPKTIKGNISVLIFGGGGSGLSPNSDNVCGGGGSGWMNNGEFSIAGGTQIPITIGNGGSLAGQSGGTTTFGTYLSANGGVNGGYSLMRFYGGSGGAGGGGSDDGGTGYQFGGGGGKFRSGGRGGTWGGGGGSGLELRSASDGGDGGTYGGGGGGSGGGFNTRVSSI